MASPAVNYRDVVSPLRAFTEFAALLHHLLFGNPLVVTSGKDAIHSTTSQHAFGKAVDVRTKDKTPEEQLLFISILTFSAPANFVCIFDERALPGQEHIHLEYHGA
jgi:hypothetical protein